jgi:regulator of protease activity HflC (stomatin/prohibitin superfamily)
VLAVLFFASGSQSVAENERGIKLLFGEKVGEVDPGLSWNPPYPAGELIKVDVGRKELRLQKEFWVHIADERDLIKPIEQLPKLASLTPGQGGYSITSDGNMAHSQWTVAYTREGAADFANNVLEDQEIDLITTAVRRGIVQACSKVPIEELLKQSAGEGGRVATKARGVAQAQLDRIKSGIRIQQLLLESVMPPLFVRDRFNNVQSAVSEGNKSRDESKNAATQTLNGKAGESVEGLVRLIDAYELAVEGHGTRPKDEILAQINAVLSGTSTDVDGGTIPGVRSGEVSKIIAEARQYRSEVVTRRRAEWERYNAKLAQFKSNPRLMVAGEVASAINTFMAGGDIQLLALPPRTNYIELALNRDPEIVKRLKQAQLQAQGIQSQLNRMKALENEKHKPSSGPQAQQ